MNIFYGLDNTLVNQEINKFIDIKLKDNDYAPTNTYYLDQETLDEQITQILNEVSTINIFNQKKIILINDYHFVLKSNINLINNFFNQINKFNKHLIIIKFITNEIKLPIDDKLVKYNFVKSYSKHELKKWILNRAKQYKLIINEVIIGLIINMYPNDLTIIDNELKQLKNLDQETHIEVIKKNCNKYFNPNIYILIDSLLTHNYSQFWTEYRKYWQKINYDSYNIFSILVMRLEVSRNIKVLQKITNNEKEILNKLNISFLQYRSLLKYKFSIEKLNELLSLAYAIDFKIKNGKTNKNIAIDLFFLKI